MTEAFQILPADPAACVCCRLSGAACGVPFLSGEATGLEIVAKIPSDPAVADFDVRGQGVAELPADGPALVAVDDLVSVLLERRRR